jgi:putative hydroxymethylpyrimidine transport system substrate-binding protein
MRVRPTLAVLAIALVASVSGCGAQSEEVDPQARLLLDFTPNAIHTGIYTAKSRGYDTGEGVKLSIVAPSQGSDAVKLLAADKVDFALLDIHDLALARERGAKLVGVMAIVQRPLASVIAQPGTPSPKALEGKRVGVAGLPSDTAVLRSVVTGAGGDPGKVKETTIGFNAVSALLSRKVAGATAFWNAEGVALQRKRPGFRIFKVDDYGAPAYPELILCTTEQTLRERKDVVDGLVSALERGYGQVLQDPETSVSELLARTHGLDRAETQAELDAVSPDFEAPDGKIGELDRGRLEAWAKWDVKFGILKKRPYVAKLFRLSN